jgi:hypothetical protein
MLNPSTDRSFCHGWSPFHGLGVFRHPICFTFSLNDCELHFSNQSLCLDSRRLRAIPVPVAGFIAVVTVLRTLANSRLGTTRRLGAASRVVGDVGTRIRG